MWLSITLVSQESYVHCVKRRTLSENRSLNSDVTVPVIVVDILDRVAVHVVCRLCFVRGGECPEQRCTSCRISEVGADDPELA